MYCMSNNLTFVVLLFTVISDFNMTTIRPVRGDDLFRLNVTNLDPLTENYNLSFYFTYFSHWPDLFQVCESLSGKIMGYFMGKSEAKHSPQDWHGHVTALTVTPEFRRIGLASQMMQTLEDICERKRCYYIDLFVRVSNEIAVNMYTSFGYVVYRTVLEYYSGAKGPDENAYDMRKALSRDTAKKSMIPLPRPVTADEVT